MPTFISLLRGINVSGQRKIRMAELKDAYEALGLTNVNTHVQSGNVVFNCRIRSASKIVALLEQQIASCFGYDVTVMVRTPSDFERIIRSNPFSVQAKKDPTKVHLTFLASRPSAGMVKSVEVADMRGDEFSVGQQVRISSRGAEASCCPERQYRREKRAFLPAGGGLLPRG